MADSTSVSLDSPGSSPPFGEVLPGVRVPLGAPVLSLETQREGLVCAMTDRLCVYQTSDGSQHSEPWASLWVRAVGPMQGPVSDGDGLAHTLWLLGEAVQALGHVTVHRDDHTRARLWLHLLRHLHHELSGAWSHHQTIIAHEAPPPEG